MRFCLSSSSTFLSLSLSLSLALSLSFYPLYTLSPLKDLDVVHRMPGGGEVVIGTCHLPLGPTLWKAWNEHTQRLRELEEAHRRAVFSAEYAPKVRT